MQHFLNVMTYNVYVALFKTEPEIVTGPQSSVCTEGSQREKGGRKTCRR